MLRFTLLIAVLWSAAAAFAAVPGHYLVFEIDGDDAITLLAAENVFFATTPGWNDAGAAPARADSFEIELVDDAGRTIYRTTKHVERALRAEPGELARERSSFVVRVPRGGNSVRVTSARLPHAAEFSVRAIPSRIATLSSRATVRSESTTARPENRLDLLIVGDGYTAEQASRFHGDVARMTDEFFSIEPYRTYRSYINVSSLFVPSAQEGADHPPCSDPSPDPREGTFVDTAFDATFCTGEILRLLTVSTWKVELAASVVPDWDMIMVLVNDPLYGGAGGPISVVSRNENATAVLQHEFGHSFTRLADEYSYPLPGGPQLCRDGADTPEYFRCAANVTDQTDRAKIKWAPWIAPSTPVPTPDAFGGVGLFLGANYSTVGQYRPKFECLMNLGKRFCEVCTQEFIRRIYRGWGGVPADGVSPIDAVTPAPGSIRVTPGVPIEFTASLLHTAEGAPAVEWLVNGEVVSAGNASFTYVPTAATTAIELRVTDRTKMVHPQMANGVLTKTRTWTLSTAGLPRRRAARH
jgi:hypothetical protein